MADRPFLHIMPPEFEQAIVRPDLTLIVYSETWQRVDYTFQQVRRVLDGVSEVVRKNFIKLPNHTVIIFTVTEKADEEKRGRSNVHFFSGL